MTDGFVRGTPRPPEQLVLDTEILVLGGGLPGVCAAIAAAEAGCTVTLVEKSLTLGGNCGPEIGVHPSDAHRFHTYMVSTGTVGRLIEDAAFHQAKTVSDDEHYNISMRWDSVMREALDRAGVRVLLSHYAHTPYIEENRITAVVCEDTLTYQQVLIRVSHFVIDDTGDGNVAERAGANYRMGRESRQEHGERLAPEEADSQTMGASLVALIQKTEKDRVFLPPKDTPPFYPGYGGDLNWRIPDSWYPHFFFPTETGGDLDVIRDGQEVYRRLRSHLDSAWNRLKNDVNGDNGRNWEMVWVSQKVAKRESRRFEGDYWLTETDVETGRQFDDAIGVGGFAMDIHDPKPENPEYVKITYYLIPPVYTIPYRCTYSKTVENLFFASRLLSATHLAHGTVRLQRTLAALAQAVGTAAALCVRQGISPRELLAEGRMADFQQRLLREDATIPNRRNEDAADHARRARVTASSELRYGVEGEATFEPIGRVAGAELWDFTDRLDYAEVLLRNPDDRPATVHCRLERFTPEHPWQYRDSRPLLDYYALPNEAEWGSEWRMKFFHPVAECAVEVPAGFEGYVRFPLMATFPPKNPLTDDDRMALTLRSPGSRMEIGRCDRLLPFVRSIEGYEIAHTGEPAYTVRPRTCVYRLSPSPLWGEACQVLNGHNRRFSENPRNMWQPARLPADLSLEWDEEVLAGEVRITFDTLTRTWRTMPFECGARVSPQCVKAFTLTLYHKGEAVYTHREENWYHRLAVLPLPGVAIDRLVLTVEETWEPGETPGVYEIRVY